MFFKIANSQNLFVKISWIGPWVRRIDWCEGHWLSSTYIVVRLSDIRAKTGKKCIFCEISAWIISNPWCYLRVDQGCLTHQKRQNIGDSSGNRLFLDWFITEDTMKKRPDSFFNFLFGTKHTLKSSSNTKTNTYVTLLLSKSIFWLVFCTALEPAIQRRYFSKTNWETFYFAIEEGFRKDISAELCNVILLLIFDSHPFNLHPEKWFKGYPVKSTQIFIGCHLRFF